MLAVVIHGAHDLRVEARDAPEAGPGEALVRLGAGGICGSDLHYFEEGGIGDYPVKEPLVLGHEMAGTVVALGAGTNGPPPGSPVAIDPTTLPSDGCVFAARGEGHLSPRVQFAGSSRTMPHVQGYFAELVAVPAAQLHPVPPSLPLRQAALAEPFAVCLHAVSRAGPLVGRTVLVTGAGPIGCLAVAAARLAGAQRIIVTDRVARCLDTARRLGADEAVDVATDRGLLEALATGAGTVDVVLECSGAPPALADGLRAVRRGGRFVQVGVLPRGEHAFPVDMVISKEIDYRGSFRFTADDFSRAVAAIAGGRVDLRPVLSAEMPLEEAGAAFALARDRTRALKVHLVAA